MNKPFQRKGAISNSHVGRELETKALAFFARQGLELTLDISIKIGINGQKPHSFDLGSETKKVLVECKAHTWTESGNVPSAKLKAWNEAMLLFHATPTGYRKILFIQHDFNPQKRETLGQYYIRTNSHLIPNDVEIWEFDESQGIAKKIN
jgi:hypothetical protein